MRRHAHTHTHTCTTWTYVDTSPVASRVSCFEEKKKNVYAQKRTIYIYATNKIRECLSRKRRALTAISLDCFGPLVPPPSPLGIRTTWDFPGHGPTTLNSSLDVIIHTHIYFYFYRHVRKVCMYIHIYPFSAIILSFLVPRHLPIVFPPLFHVRSRIIGLTKGLKIVTGNIVNTKDDNSVL